MYRIGFEEVSSLEKLIKSGQLWRYRKNSEAGLFETELADTLAAKHALLLSSGTAGLISALVAMGIGPGDEVLIPAYTFIATAIAPLAVGAVPILVEADETLTINPEDITSKITPRTKAVIPVHINGLPCAMDAITKIASANNLLVLEDACQSIGGSYKDQNLGTLGDMGVFSFNYFKIISCGEGGAVVSNNTLFFERARIYHDCGVNFFAPGHEVKVPFFAGVNMRISEILAAVLRVQLTRLEGILADLRVRKRLLSAILDGGNGYKLSPVNDPQGDCGVKLGLIFQDGSQVQELIGKASVSGLKLDLECPFYTERHVYINWEAVMENRGALHPGQNPYNRVNMKYSKDMCPKTLDYLKRTVYIYIDPDMDMETVKLEGELLRKMLRQ